MELTSEIALKKAPLEAGLIACGGGPEAAAKIDVI
jgi:hypothetical protein